MSRIFKFLNLRERTPWVFLFVAFMAAVVPLISTWPESLVYDRSAFASGEFWRIWTGQVVHFGWPHVLADVGLFLILGWLLERKFPIESYLALTFMPLAIIGAQNLWDPELVRYGGLSGINFGLLVFLAMQGWQRNWVDWFWPAILLLYIAELVLESTVGHGQGGGAIRFNDPAVRVATMAHVGGGLFGLGLWMAGKSWGRFLQPISRVAERF